MLHSKASSVVKVTVSVTTYNHARYIRKALESVAGQLTPFDYEIIIGDDGSDDGTADLVDEFARDYDRPIRVFHRLREPAGHSGPMGFDSARRNYWALMRAARGEYVAHLDGDDYWLCCDKLSRQVRLLEARPDLAACFAAARVVDAKGCDMGNVLRPSRQEKSFSLADLLVDNPANSPTLMFRRSALAVHCPWFDRMPGVFWPTLVASALVGDLGFDDRIMGCYRLHDSAVHSGLGRVRKTELSLLGRVALRGELPRQFSSGLEAAIDIWQSRLNRAIQDANHRAGPFRHAWRRIYEQVQRARSWVRA